jgi:outer membrane protein assembly factor BamB
VDKLIGFGIVVAGGAIAVPLCDPSTGVQGMGILMGPLPAVITVWVLWTLLSRRATPVVQRVGLVIAMVLAWGWMPLVRLNGVTGDLQPEYHWRWTPTAEESYLAERSNLAGHETGDEETRSVRLRPGDWPGFRGPNRDGIARAVKIRTEWSSHPPGQVWRHRVGPAWSSIIVVDGRLFTQEQHRGKEAVVCYEAGTGEELWSHEDETRFDEETAGPGPRATPCFHEGRIFSLGCNGLVNCLDAATGERLWHHDLKTECGAEVPHWGFTASPVVVANLVVVFGGGKSGNDLVAYDCKTGTRAWVASAGETSYGSPQVAEVAGREQVLMLTNHGVTGVDPETGARLWDYAAPLPPSAPRSIVPQVYHESQVLFASEGDLGLGLLDINRDSGTWTANQRWVTRALKPAFNDPVIWKGHVYGFDGRIFGCVDLETGQSCWKNGRYGEGQVLLIADQDLLLVISEKGQLVLLRANPERHEELVRFQAIEGKTWNHPTLVGGRLYVRNATEMACYDVRPVQKR